MKKYMLLNVFFIFFVLLSTYGYSGEISKEAQFHFLKGLKYIEDAKSPQDYILAESEFEKVIELSPQWPNGYYNLALICEATGKERKAIKNYEIYLKYIHDEMERKKTIDKIEHLKIVRETKKRIGLSGLSLVSLKDGIYILNLIEGSKLKRAGFAPGDKIVEINKRPVRDMTLEEFYKLIDKPHENVMLNKRLGAYGKNVGIDMPVAFTIIRGNRQMVIVSPLSYFKTDIYEIEEEEMDEEVFKSQLPVALITWMNWCSYCHKLIPLAEKLSDKFRGKVKFLTINLEFNKKFSEKFGIKGAPVTLIFSKGQLAGSYMGFKGDENYEQWFMDMIK